MTPTLLLFIGSALASYTRVPVTTATTTQRCADGSLPVVYVDPANVAAQANLWLIHLQGDGGECVDEATCGDLYTTEPRALGTGCAYNSAGKLQCKAQGAATSTWPATVTRNGLLGDNAANLFDNVTRVQIVSCTADHWMGDGPTSAVAPATGSFVPTVPIYTPLSGFPDIRFNGRRVLDAVIDFLTDTSHGKLPSGFPSLEDAQTVLFAGSGTGAAGVLANVDRLRDTILANAAAAHPEGEEVDVRGLVDSEPVVFAVDNVVLDDGGLSGEPACFAHATGDWDTNPFASLDVERDAWNAMSDDDCEAVATDPGACLRVPVLLTGAYTTTPLFVRQDLRDESMLAPYEDPALALGDPLECMQETVLSMGWSVARNPAVQGWFLSCGGEHVGIQQDAPAFTEEIAPAFDVAGRAISFHDLVVSWLTGGTYTRAAAIYEAGTTTDCLVHSYGVAP